MDEEGEHPARDSMENLIIRAFEKQERQAAHDLIQGAFPALPDELQELYLEVRELHKQGKFEQASSLFEEWMDLAREMGLI